MKSAIDSAISPLRLRLLLEVERCGSISAAADVCGIGQPSASTHLQILEGALGHKLIERSGRRSRLTEAGRLAARHAARVLESLEGMRADLDALNGVANQTLTLAASTTPGSYLLPEILRCLAEHHPQIQVKVTIGPSEWVVEQVARRDAQLGIAGEVEATSGLVFEPFIEDELVAVAPPGHFGSKNRSVTHRQLENETLLLREQGSNTRQIAERNLSEVGLDLTNVWEFDANEAIKRAVRAGLGVGFLSRLTVEEEVDRGELATFRVRGCAPMKRQIHLVRPDDRQPTRSEAAFAATLAHCCNVTIKSCAVDSPRPGELA